MLQHISSLAQWACFGSLAQEGFWVGEKGFEKSQWAQGVGKQNWWASALLHSCDVLIVWWCWEGKHCSLQVTFFM